MRQIKQVLSRSPAAADTAKGIHDWWVGWREPAPPVATTQEALHRLQKEGLVVAVQVEGGQQVWQTKPSTGLGAGAERLG